MATYTVTGVDPSFRIPGVPNEVRNVGGASGALEAVREMQRKGRQDITVIQHHGPEVSLDELARLAAHEASGTAPQA